MSNKKTLILEYDDFHWKSPENCLDTIKHFVESFPKIKISLFTTPHHSGFFISDNKIWCDEVRKLIESKNVCLAIHGLKHTQEEFKYLNYGQAASCLILSQGILDEANLPYVKVFRGPHWGIGQGTYTALIKLGYTHVYTHDDYKELAKNNDDFIKSVFYNWNLKDSPPEENFLIGHGHTHNVCQNGIAETFGRVSEFIRANNPDFKFVNEV